VAGQTGLLDAAVVGVGDEDADLAPLADVGAGVRELLDALVAGVGDVHVAASVGVDAQHVVELPVAGPVAAPGRQALAGRREPQHTLRKPGDAAVVGEVPVAAAVDVDVRRDQRLAGRTDERRLAEQRPLCVERLDAALGSVTSTLPDSSTASPSTSVNCPGSRPCEPQLATTRPPRA
jgi:hypothetical protein